jgi:hypothetical protein
MSTPDITVHFHAGTNEPGYLPDDLPATFATWDEARRYVIGELLLDADNVASWNEPHDCDDVPCPTFGDDCTEGRASDLTNVAEDLNLSNGPDWSTITAGRSYWIHSCGCAAGTAELADDEPERPAMDLAELEAHAMARTPWPKTPNMTRAHFAYVARIIASLRPGDDVAECFAHHLTDTNPRFDRDRFIAAATA